MTLEIRALTPADAEACDAVLRSLPYHFGDPGGQEECARAVRACDGLVALRDGEIVGFLTIEPHFETTSEITWMAVHAGHRGQRIGHRMIERLVSDLRAAGQRFLFVATLSDLRPEPGVKDGYNRTRAFYRSAGFTPALNMPDMWPGNPAMYFVMYLGQTGPVGPDG
jgi:ribosomal protein S18 acetylase RimI-like enzyme